MSLTRRNAVAGTAALLAAAKAVGVSGVHAQGSTTPEVRKAVRRVNYHMEDGAEIIDGYRRDLESKSIGGVKFLTDGKRDSRYVSPYVRTFLSEDQY